MRTGTCHFVSLADAVAYYARQGLTRTDVKHKLTEGEIYIGKPPTKPGQRLTVILGEGRYQIEESNQ